MDHPARPDSEWLHLFAMAIRILPLAVAGNSRRVLLAVSSVARGSLPGGASDVDSSRGCRRSRPPSLSRELSRPSRVLDGGAWSGRACGTHACLRPSCTLGRSVGSSGASPRRGCRRCLPSFPSPHGRLGRGSDTFLVRQCFTPLCPPMSALDFPRPIPPAQKHEYRHL